VDLGDPGTGTGRGHRHGDVARLVAAAGHAEAWAWRHAFLVALPVGLVGLYLRLRLDETPRFRAVQRADGSCWSVLPWLPRPH
jgi:MFS family permease